MLPPQLLIDEVERVLAPVDQRDRRRLEGRHLPRELGADRTAAAGDQHPAPGDVGAHDRRVELHRIAPQQVLHPHRAQLAHQHAPRERRDRRAGS